MSYKRGKNKYKPYRHWYVDYNLLRKGFEANFTGNETALNKLAGIGATYTKLVTLDSDVTAPRLICTGGVSTGKTTAIRFLAKNLHVPIVSISGGEITPSGYRGTNLSSALKGLINQAGSVENLEKFGGIVHIDEIDKWILSKSNDKFYENIIYNMFGLMGGEIVQVDADEYGTENFQLNTQKIMVILSGAFAWLKENSLSDSDRAIKSLLRVGFPNEFCSRITDHVHFNKLKICEIEKVIHGKSQKLSECFQAGDHIPSISRAKVKKIASLVVKNRLGIRSAHRLIAEEFYIQSSKQKEFTI